jgi:molybdate transport system regulatory protein
MKIAYRIWLDNEGKAFGEGPYRVLRQIEKTGSLHQAAMDLKISYRKAWLIIQTIEKRLGFEFLERKVGGVSGGGSQITLQERVYEKLRKIQKRSRKSPRKNISEAFRIMITGPISEIVEVEAVW